MAKMKNRFLRRGAKCTKYFTQKQSNWLKLERISKTMNQTIGPILEPIPCSVSIETQKYKILQIQLIFKTAFQDWWPSRRVRHIITCSGHFFRASVFIIFFRIWQGFYLCVYHWDNWRVSIETKAYIETKISSDFFRKSNRGLIGRKITRGHKTY